MKKIPFLIICTSLVSVPLMRGIEPAKAQPAKQGNVNEFMQRKQKLAHEVFDAIIMKDFRRIRKDAELLVALRKAAEFQVHKTPRYLQYSLEFREAAAKMAKNAVDENQDGTTLAFLKMTLSCVHCHDYIREKHSK